MGNLNWQATTPQNMAHPSAPSVGKGGPLKASGKGAPLAVKQSATRDNSALVKAKQKNRAGQMSRQQFDATVAQQSTKMGSSGGV
jgi:hypothetical protein